MRVPEERKGQCPKRLDFNTNSGTFLCVNIYHLYLLTVSSPMLIDVIAETAQTSQVFRISLLCVIKLLSDVCSYHTEDTGVVRDDATNNNLLCIYSQSVSFVLFTLGMIYM